MENAKLHSIFKKYIKGNFDIKHLPLNEYQNLLKNSPSEFAKQNISAPICSTNDLEVFTIFVNDFLLDEYIAERTENEIEVFLKIVTLHEEGHKQTIDCRKINENLRQNYHDEYIISKKIFDEGKEKIKKHLN